MATEIERKGEHPTGQLGARTDVTTSCQLELSPIRDRLGSHWTLYAKAVYDIAESVVRRSIGSRDRYSRTESTIDIEFEASPGRDVRSAMADIENRIAETFSGVRAVATAPPVESANDAVTIRRPERPASPTEPEFDIVARIRADAEAPPRRSDRGASALLRDAALQSVPTQPALGDLQMAAAGGARRLAPAIPIHEALFAQIRVTYRAIWNVRNRVIAVYRATPTLVDNNRVLRGDAVLRNLGSRQMIARLDELVLSTAVLDLEELVRGTLNILMVVPIHVASFADDWSSKALLKLCAKIPEAARGNVIFEVQDALHSHGDAKFRSSMRLLRPLCRRFGATMPLRSRDFRYLRELGFATIAVEASEQFGSETEIIDCLDQFRMSAHRDGLLSAVWGLKTRSLVLAASTMGFDFVHGDMIGCSTIGGQLDRANFDFADLYDDDAAWL